MKPMTSTLTLATEKDFFKRGKKLAQQADSSTPIQAVAVLSFEDAGDLLRMLTVARLNVFQAVKAQPDSITGIALRLQRDRSAVKRDVDCLANAGLIHIEDQVCPGHGRMKWLRPAAHSVRLEAML